MRQEEENRVLESEILRCQDCGATLCEVVLTETNDDRYEIGLDPWNTVFKIVNSCPNCKGSSNVSQVFSGTTHLGTFADNYYFEPVNQDEIEDTSIKAKVLYMELELKER